MGNELKVAPCLVNIGARILATPSLKHATQFINVDGRSKWSHPKQDSENIPLDTFRKPYAVRSFRVGVLYDDDCTDRLLMEGRLALLISKLRQYGLQPSDLTRDSFKLVHSRSTTHDLSSAFDTTSDALGNPEVLVLYSSRRIAPARYAAFKHFSDLQKSRISICIIAQGGDSFSKKLCGVAAKLNAKLRDSYNHGINLRKGIKSKVLDETLIIGASLSHPDITRALKGTPSIVSVVGCQPSTTNAGYEPRFDVFCHYHGSVSLQGSHNG